MLISGHTFFRLFAVNLPPFNSQQGRGKDHHSPYQKAMVKPRCHIWTHEFICLADSHQEQVPSVSECHRLWSAGLGENTIVFHLDGGWCHIKDVLMETFPPLNSAGGMELLHTAGSYSKNLVVIETKYIISVLRLKECVDQA